MKLRVGGDGKEKDRPTEDPNLIEGESSEKELGRLPTTT